MLPLNIHGCNSRGILRVRYVLRTLSNSTVHCHSMTCRELSPAIVYKVTHLPTHPALHDKIKRTYCTDEKKDEAKKPAAPPFLFNVTFSFIFSHVFNMLFNKHVMKLAKLNTKAFLDGIVFAFFEVHKNVVDKSYEDLENMMTTDMFIRLKKDESYKSPNIPALESIERKDLASMSLAQLQVHRDKFSGLYNVEVLVRYSYAKDFRTVKRTVNELRFAHYRFLRTVDAVDGEVSDWKLMFVYYYPMSERFFSPPTK